MKRLFINLLLLTACGAKDHFTNRPWDFTNKPWCQEGFCFNPDGKYISVSVAGYIFELTLKEFINTESKRGVIINLDDAKAFLKENPIQVNVVGDLIIEAPSCIAPGCRGTFRYPNKITIVLFGGEGSYCLANTTFVHELIHAFIANFDLALAKDPKKAGEIYSEAKSPHPILFFYVSGSLEERVVTQINSLYCPPESSKDI